MKKLILLTIVISLLYFILFLVRFKVFDDSSISSAIVRYFSKTDSRTTSHHTSVNTYPAVPIHPMYRGNQQRTGVYNTDGGLKYGRIEWKIKVDRTVEGSPVIYNDTAYFTTDFGHLYAIDLKSGKEKWKAELRYLRGFAPAVAYDLILVGSENYLIALDINTGQEKWKFNAYDPVGSTPLIESGIVYFGSVNKVFYAVDLDTGMKMWEFRTEGYVQTSPATFEGVIVFGSNDSHIYALDMETGKKIWKFKAESVPSTPVISNGKVYFSDWNGNLYAVDFKIGMGKWSRKGVGGGIPTVSRGLIFYTTSSTHWNAFTGEKPNSYLYGVDAETGEETFKIVTEGGQMSVPSIADGVAYFGTDKGILFAVDIATKENWSYRIEGRINAPPAIAYGAVFFGTSSLYAIPIEEIRKHPYKEQDAIDENKESYNPTATESSGLIIEEYKLVGGKKEVAEFEMSFMPDEISERRKKWRFNPVSYNKNEEFPVKMKEVEGTDEDVELSYSGLEVQKHIYDIVLEGRTVYKAAIIDYPFDGSLKAFYSHNGHWVLEHMKGIMEGKVVKGYVGDVVVDGIEIGKQHGYKEVFNYVPIKDKFFYFFVDESGKTKISYDGNVMPVTYDKVTHYGCCSEGAFNPTSHENMITFYGFREGRWHYVEAGVYEKDK